MFQIDLIAIEKNNYLLNLSIYVFLIKYSLESFLLLIGLSNKYCSNDCISISSITHKYTFCGQLA